MLMFNDSFTWFSICVVRSFSFLALAVRSLSPHPNHYCLTTPQTTITEGDPVEYDIISRVAYPNSDRGLDIFFLLKTVSACVWGKVIITDCIHMDAAELPAEGRIILVRAYNAVNFSRWRASETAAPTV